MSNFVCKDCGKTLPKDYLLKIRPQRDIENKTFIECVYRGCGGVMVEVSENYLSHKVLEK